MAVIAYSMLLSQSHTHTHTQTHLVISVVEYVRCACCRGTVRADFLNDKGTSPSSVSSLLLHLAARETQRHTDREQRDALEICDLFLTEKS